MRIDIGTYTGNDGGTPGSNPQTINLTNCTGNLSTVDSAIFLHVNGAGGGGTYYTTNTYDADNASFVFGLGAQEAGQITTLGAGSFVADGKCNAQGVVYYFLVLQSDGITQDFETGQYTGNGLDNQDGLLTYAAWVPDWVFTLSQAGSCACWVTTITTSAYSFNADVRRSNVIQSVNSGFAQLGNRVGYANDSGEVYNYFVAGKVVGFLNTISYTGDSVADSSQAVAGAGFEPEMAYTKSQGTDEPVGRNKDQAGDESFRFSDSAVVANRFESLDADGFTVGGDDEVNENGLNYQSLVFKAFAGAAVGGIVPILEHHCRMMRNQ